ncbi:transcription factor grauzone-like [Culicoides brevitarsis]|uniref:transcription factor grauzone-like n=1 Tax=Culicoides brevitarsis TaxID=469753 RepID=UPI00307C6E77
MTNIAKIITKDTVCRLCFGICNDLREIFDANTKYADRISKFLYLQLPKDDTLSTKICWSCANYLDMFQQFYTKIIDTQKHHLSTKFDQYLLEPVFIVKNFSNSCTNEVEIACKIPNFSDAEVMETPQEQEKSVEKEVLIEKTVIETLPARKTRSSVIKEREKTPELRPVTKTYKRKSRQKSPEPKETLPEVESEPELFDEVLSEDEYKPPTPKKRVLAAKAKIEKPKEIKIVKKETPVKPLRQEDYSIIAVDDPNASINDVNFSEEWPSSESFEKFPNKILDDGCLLIRGKELNDLVSKFFKLQCEICKENVRFTDIRQMYKHYKQHKTPGFVRCCGNKIEHYRAAVLHMARHLQPEAFKCHICNYIVTRPKFLEVHMKTHLPEDEKPFACPHCPKRFCWKAAFSVHLETHKSEEERKTYMCHMCPKVYDTPGGLSTHKKLVHLKYKEEKHVCHVCAKSFATKTGLNEHMNTIHQREKTQVQCKECGTWLMNKRCLKTHMMLHSDVEHRCKECDYTTKKPYLLTRHVITHHTTETKFECDTCQKKFKLKRALTCHIQQTHTEAANKTYKCNFCEKTFGSSTNFYTHRKNIHPKELAAMKQKAEEEKRLKRIEMGLEAEYTVIVDGGEKNDGEMVELIEENDGEQMVVLELQQN